MSDRPLPALDALIRKVALEEIAKTRTEHGARCYPSCEVSVPSPGVPASSTPPSHGPEQGRCDECGSPRRMHHGSDRLAPQLVGRLLDSALSDKDAELASLRAEVERLRRALVQAKTFAGHVKRAPEGWGYSVNETIFDRVGRSADDLIEDINAALAPQKAGE